ncbi:hypothetical protein D0T49_09975 [Paludibacter sp. 221]|nr:hypothetical protein [Paludibacter sp. 221]
MTVYNTATSAEGTPDAEVVMPGMYYNNGTNWIRLISQSESQSLTNVYIDTNTPTDTGAKFSINPPFDDEGDANADFVNDDSLKGKTGVLYIALDGSIWSYNGSSYVTYTAPATPATTAWYLAGTTTDAGGSKTATIERNGGLIIKNGNILQEKKTGVSGTAAARFYVNTPEYQGGAINPISMMVRMETKVANGKTNTGVAVGIGVRTYYSGASNNVGTGGGIMNVAKGIEVLYGSYAADAKGTLNEAHGLYLRAYKTSSNMKIKVLYDIYTAGGVNAYNDDNKHYGLYITGQGKKNYVGGKTLFQQGIQLSLSVDEAFSGDGLKYTLRVSGGKLQFHDGTSWKDVVLQ